MKEPSPTSPALIKVLDKGSIELLEVFGDDLKVVNTARVSFAKESTYFSDKDAKLIEYLAKHKHLSPFYHPRLSFRVRAPISVHRQWERHKIGTDMNSESTRYVTVHDEFYLPQTFRSQSASNKQGSEGEVDDQELCRFIFENSCNQSFLAYHELLRKGVAREQARGVLPLETYLTWIWTASLAAVAHFIELRDEEHAQFEIRSYAQAMKTLASKKFPVSLAALGRYP